MFVFQDFTNVDIKFIVHNTFLE